MMDAWKKRKHVDISSSLSMQFITAIAGDCTTET